MKLTPKQNAFCAAYISNGGNASAAYRECYAVKPKTADESVRVSAAKLLAMPNIALRIKELQDAAVQESVMNAAEILNEINRIALSDPRGIVHPGGKIKVLNELDSRTAASVASFKIDEFGRIEYKFWDKNSALERAAKILGLFEKDNKQKTDGFTEFFKAISGDIAGPGESLVIPEDD